MNILALVVIKLRSSTYYIAGRELAGRRAKLRNGPKVKGEPTVTEIEREKRTKEIAKR